MNDLMEETIGELEVELDGRFSSIRTRETNLGNLCEHGLFLCIEVSTLCPSLCKLTPLMV